MVNQDSCREKIRIILVAGARPNFMKIAPLIEAFTHSGKIEPYLVHTGQHYDKRMSEEFFTQLEIPEPNINLEVGSGSHAEQTAAIMRAFEPVLIDRSPDGVLVVGDVNSTIACGLTAVKMGFKLMHVEAGLRSFDRTMPEEINRLLTDSISDYLFCTERSGVENLRREGVAEEKIFLVGNVMIDTLLKHRQKAQLQRTFRDLGLNKRGYVVVTLHRPTNVDDPDTLSKIMTFLDEIANELPIVFPLHPRTRNRLQNYGYDEKKSGVRFLDPQGYLEFLNLMSNARMVITDSGGIQEETTILGIPCMTLRENTERPVTLESGCNKLVGSNPAGMRSVFREMIGREEFDCRIPPLWDGKAAERICRILTECLIGQKA